jgi:5'-deoxynucleotidase YfbR-like HD superfamily hydrolase
MKDIFTCTDEEVLAETKKLREGYKMKRIIRYRSPRDVSFHNESNAEHTFALIYLAQYFSRMEPSASSLDKEKLYSILLFHDFGEIKHGDIVSYDKTKEHEERERIAAKEVFASLPEALQTVGYDYWHEYEYKTSPEAKFAYALDKIEPMFELLDSVNEHSMHRLKVTMEKHLSNKLPPTENYPVMRRFLDVITRDMEARDIFWKE